MEIRGVAQHFLSWWSELISFARSGLVSATILGDFNQQFTLDIGSTKAPSASVPELDMQDTTPNLPLCRLVTSARYLRFTNLQGLAASWLRSTVLRAALASRGSSRR